MAARVFGIDNGIETQIDAHVGTPVMIRLTYRPLPSRKRLPAARAIASSQAFCWIAELASASAGPEARMVPFFVQIKCQLGKSYEVANELADAEIASEIYSTAGDFDLLVKFYVEEGTDIGHFVNEKVQTIPGIQDTRTILTFKAFGALIRSRSAGLRRARARCRPSWRSRQITNRPAPAMIAGADEARARSALRRTPR